MYCEVYLTDAPYAIDRPFDYECPTDVSLGNIVKVPFGRNNRYRTAVVVALKDSSDGENIKPVHSVLSSRYSLTGEMLGLCKFLKEHTLCTFGEAVRTVLPPGALSETENIRYRKTVKLAASSDEIEKRLAAASRAGIRSEGQREVLEFLLKNGESDLQVLRDLPGITLAHINALSEKGLVSVSAEEYIRNPYSGYEAKRAEEPIELTDEQSAAYGTLSELYSDDKARAALLFGVTGSGKTKVIMSLIDKTLDDGKRAIMLVPEISLTPQTVGLFCHRYGERVAVIHSSLSQGERLDAWRRIERGDVDLVIGTRSAIFAPLENIGFIVIDEEHEHTYKSESDPKYHAKDVAAYRCGRTGAMMLLASATPSFESFYKAKSGTYTLVPLRKRYGGVHLPEALIVDMREELRLGNMTPVSKRLYESLTSVGERDEQAILFLNRRGYSSQVQCRDCGEVIQCPHCSVSMTYHTERGGRLMCHMCGMILPAPRSCPSCKGEKLSYLGFGTQKLESELERILPDMRILRMDADTTGAKSAYDVMLEDFRAGRADILLGTQMVAKGHDFPRVTLVGVALADTSLYVSDFRAAERTFSLLTQVIGRAGRAKDGGVAVIQTYSPTNEVIKLACAQDYERFYESEIAVRRELSYPPFCDIVRLTVVSDDERELFDAVKRLSDSLKDKIAKEYSDLPFAVFGPFEAQVYKVNEKYRMRMTVKCRLSKRTRELFGELLAEFSKERRATLSVDFNPLTG
ncbi:MAG: primosomal protein N' [Clostridia bacterium]|nr:primosomal protein N' [Clostridia bacterium]